MRNAKKAKSRLKNLAAVGIAAAMTMTSMAAPVFADSANPETTNATIDTSKTGSITIFKVKENNGKTIDNMGRQGKPSSTQTPMKDVEFSAIKVADIETLTTKNGVGVYFDNLDQDFKDLILKSAAKDVLVAAADKDGTVVTNGSDPVVTRPDGSRDTQAYTTETMQAVMDKINATQGGEKSLNEFVMNKRDKKAQNVSVGTTDATGKAVLDRDGHGLELGLYLVCETDISKYDPQTGADLSTASGIKGQAYSDASGQITVDPHETATGQDKYVGDTTRDEVIANQSSPLLVSVPMTNQTEIGKKDAGTVWQYDVTVYPKNQTINNPKRIIKEDDQDTLIDHGDYEIGETVHQVLLPEAPMLQKDNGYTKYTETDTMDNGLTFDKINGVYIVPRKANPEKISDYGKLDENFKLSGNAVELTEEKEGTKGDYTLTQGAKDANGSSSFTVALTESGLAKLNAIKEDSQVMILFDSVLNKSTKHVGDAVEEQNQPTLTWNTSDNDYEHSIKGNKVGVYTYKLNVTKNGVKDPTRVSFTFKREGTGAGGHENHVKNSDVKFVREGDGIYHLYDRSSDTDEPTTTVHPGSDGKLYIKGLDEEHYIMTETATEGRNDNSNAKSHELLKSEVTIALTSTPIDENSNHGVTGVLNARKTTITADGNTAAIAVDKGTASFNVENYESLNLRTGGEGRAMVYGATLLVVVGAGSILVIATRKKRKAV